MFSTLWNRNSLVLSNFPLTRGTETNKELSNFAKLQFLKDKIYSFTKISNLAVSNLSKLLLWSVLSIKNGSFVGKISFFVSEKRGNKRIFLSHCLKASLCRLYRNIHCHVCTLDSLRESQDQISIPIIRKFMKKNALFFLFKRCFSLLWSFLFTETSIEFIKDSPIFNFRLE